MKQPTFLFLWARLGSSCPKAGDLVTISLDNEIVYDNKMKENKINGWKTTYIVRKYKRGSLEYDISEACCYYV